VSAPPAATFKPLLGSFEIKAGMASGSLGTAWYCNNIQYSDMRLFATEIESDSFQMSQMVVCHNRPQHCGCSISQMLLSDMEATLQVLLPQTLKTWLELSDLLKLTGSTQ
jgi:hypothetical protein